jgi:hypothetical protein
MGYAPQQNSTAERLAQTFINMDCALHYDALLSPCGWVGPCVTQRGCATAQHILWVWPIQSSCTDTIHRAKR